MAEPTGFTWVVRKNGDVEVKHHGRRATTLRGAKAQQFLTRSGDGDPQHLLARLTGNYKRGNERS